MQTKGFSLIETLAVVLIVGILTAIAVPQYQKAVIKARGAEARTNLQSIVQAQQVYYTTYSTFSSDLDALDVQITNKNGIKYSCPVTTSVSGIKSADCWARLDKYGLRYNFSLVDDLHVGLYCLGKKGSVAEQICKKEGTYAFLTSDGEYAYYRM